MIKSIIYWSNYGSTQRYAELLSKDMGIPASPLHNAGASDGELFIWAALWMGAYGDMPAQRRGFG